MVSKSLVLSSAGVQLALFIAGLLCSLQALNAGYLVWRALRTLRPGWGYFYR
jgi:hypothetical protein